LIRNPSLGPALAHSKLHSLSQIRASLYSSPPECPKTLPFTSILAFIGTFKMGFKNKTGLALVWA